MRQPELPIAMIRYETHTADIFWFICIPVSEHFPKSSTGHKSWGGVLGLGFFGFPFVWVGLFFYQGPFKTNKQTNF